MTFTSSLRFLYTLGCSGPRCAAAVKCRRRRHALFLAKKVQILLARKSEQTELPGTRLLSMNSEQNLNLAHPSLEGD